VRSSQVFKRIKQRGKNQRLCNSRVMYIQGVQINAPESKNIAYRLHLGRGDGGNGGILLWQRANSTLSSVAVL